ncbi:MAG: chorismate mutase [Cyanobacteria bacterium P01_H01_bin.15]
MDCKVRGIRGATTVTENSAAAMGEAVSELLDEIVARNAFEPEEVVCAIFSATADLDAMFPAAIARARPGWDCVPLLDVQQMQVQGSLPRCIRVLIQVNLNVPAREIIHPYLRQASALRPDRDLTPLSVSPQTF